MTSRSGWRRWRAPVVIGLAVVAVAVGAAFANVALLGSTGEDRLGRLSPVDPALTSTGPSTVTAPPAATTTPGDDHGGSSGGSGRGRGGDADD